MRDKHSTDKQNQPCLIHVLFSFHLRTRPQKHITGRGRHTENTTNSETSDGMGGTGIPLTEAGNPHLNFSTIPLFPPIIYFLLHWEAPHGDTNPRETPDTVK